MMWLTEAMTELRDRIFLEKMYVLMAIDTINGTNKRCLLLESDAGILKTSTSVEVGLWQENRLDAVA